MVLAHRALLFLFDHHRGWKKSEQCCVSVRLPFQRLKNAPARQLGGGEAVGLHRNPRHRWSARRHLEREIVSDDDKQNTTTPWHSSMASVRRKKPCTLAGTIRAFETRKQVEAADITASQSSLAEETSARPLLQSSAPSA